MIYIFVDESEDESIFVVGGIATFVLIETSCWMEYTRPEGISETKKVCLKNRNLCY